MSRKDDEAAFYEAHKDDPELWGEPEQPKAKRRRSGLSATITVRFSADEAAAIRRVAHEMKLTYSEVVRKAVQVFTRPRVPITHPATLHLFEPNDAAPGTEGGAGYRPRTDATTMTH